MVPSDPIALLILLAVFPGWVFARTAERRVGAAERSALDEFIGIAAVGLGATIAATAVFAAVSTLPWRLIDVGVLVHTVDVSSFFRANWASFSTATLIIIAFAGFIAWAAARIVYRSTPAELQSSMSARQVLVSSRPAKTTPFVTVRLTDGRTMHGLLRGQDLHPSSGFGDIALQPPIYEELPGEPRQELSASGLLISGPTVVTVLFAYVPNANL